MDCEVSEKALHHIEPRSAGWSEVEMKPGVAPLPGLDFVMFMGGVVVADDVDLLVFRGAFANQVQEADPFLMAVFFHAGSNDFAVRRIHGGKERGGPVALIVMRQGLATPLLERQARLRSIQCLDLALLIARKHG